MQALADNRRVHADEIAVQAIDDVVILRGTVGSLVQQVEAARTARRVLGVQSVEDQLQVRLMGPDERADADTKAAVLGAGLRGRRYDRLAATPAGGLISRR